MSSTNPNSCSTGTALWELDIGPGVLARGVAKIQVLLSKLGQSQVWGRCSEGGRGQRGRFGWDGPVAPPESLGSKAFLLERFSSQGKNK